MGILILIAAFEISYIRVCAQRKNCKKKYIEKCCYRHFSKISQVVEASIFWVVKKCEHNVNQSRGNLNNFQMNRWITTLEFLSVHWIQILLLNFFIKLSRFVSSTTDVQKYIFYSLVYSVKNLDALLVPIVMPAGGTPPPPLEDFVVKVAIRRHFFSHLSNSHDSHDKTNDHTERRKNLKMRLVQGPPSNKFEEEAS